MADSPPPEPDASATPGSSRAQASGAPPGSRTGGPFFPGFDYTAARRPFTYDVFLSSSGEVATLRDEVEELVLRAFSPALAHYGNAQINVVRWEQALAQQQPGETVNETFVRTALSCHHTLVLLMTHLGPGTREEVEAVIEQGRPVSIVRFAPPTDHMSDFDASEIDDFIQGFKDRGIPVLYEPCDEPRSKKAWEALSKTLAGIALGAYRKYLDETKQPLSELRG